MTDKEIMENHKKPILMLENLLDAPDFKAKKKKFLKQIFKIKNDIKDI